MIKYFIIIAEEYQVSSHDTYIKLDIFELNKVNFCNKLMYFLEHLNHIFDISYVGIVEILCNYIHFRSRFTYLYILIHYIDILKK